MRVSDKLVLLSLILGAISGILDVTVFRSSLRPTPFGTFGLAGTFSMIILRFLFVWSRNND